MMKDYVMAECIDLITIKDACEKLSICKTTCYKLIGIGALEATYVASGRRIFIHSVESYLNRHRLDYDECVPDELAEPSLDLGDG